MWRKERIQKNAEHCCPRKPRYGTFCGMHTVQDSLLSDLLLDSCILVYLSRPFLFVFTSSPRGGKGGVLKKKAESRIRTARHGWEADSRTQANK